MQDEKREFILWDKYTGEDIESYPTRSRANAAQRVYEVNDEWNTRVRVLVTMVERTPPPQPIDTTSKVNGNEPS